METIYDHNPTQAELVELADGASKEVYMQHWMFSKEHSLLDIALLYEMRGNTSMAKQYGDLVPDLYQQWQWGLDNVSISS